MQMYIEVVSYTGLNSDGLNSSTSPITNLCNFEQVINHSESASSFVKWNLAGLIKIIQFGNSLRSWGTKSSSPKEA